MKVRDYMSDKVYSCTPSTSVYDAAKLMQENHVGCIPICDNENCMIGVVTDRDLVLRCIANDKNAKETPVSDIMTTNVWTCKPDDEMSNAQNKMGEEQVRRLPVVDNNGKVIGMLTIGDLVNNDLELGQNEVSDTLNSICEWNEENKNAE